MPDAVQLLQDLAMTAENEAVQLAALKEILDRAGLGKQTQITVTVDDRERALVRSETEALLHKLVRKQEALPPVTPSLEALLVLEDEGADVPTDQDICEAEVVSD